MYNSGLKKKADKKIADLVKDALKEAKPRKPTAENQAWEGEMCEIIMMCAHLVQSWL
jgi:hypothetical protein